MSSPEYLKDSYRGRLHAVLAINVALFWATIVSGADFSTFDTLLSSLSANDGITGLVAPVVAFILDGLVSADTKARLVYCRYRHPLPGSRAFSVHLPREPRADPERLSRAWGEFPSSPSGQNRLWYRLYLSVDQQIRVQETHRAWLFSRDLTAYGAMFLVVLGIATLFIDAPSSIAFWYLLGLVVQFLATATAARNYGVRFVRTVLALASQGPDVDADAPVAVPKERA